MIQKISQQPLAKRFDHLREVIASPRFLQMRGLNNDLPFYICEFKASEAFEIQRMRRQLVNTLAGVLRSMVNVTDAVRKQKEQQS